MSNGDRAYQYYRQINPAAKNDTIDGYEIEPYHINKGVTSLVVGGEAVKGYIVLFSPKESILSKS